MEILAPTLWEFQLVWPLWKRVWSFLKKKKPKIKLSYDPTILLLDIYLKKKMKAII